MAMLAAIWRTHAFLDWRVQGGGIETEAFKTQDAR